MPAPSQGRPDQVYLAEIAASLYAYAIKPSIGIALTLPPPDPSEPQNVLLRKIAQAMYELYDPFSFKPVSPATDNAYLYSIARNAFVAYPDVLTSQGRPDQVYLYQIVTNLGGFVLNHGGSLAQPMANPAFNQNRLLYIWASLANDMFLL